MRSWMFTIVASSGVRSGGSVEPTYAPARRSDCNGWEAPPDYHPGIHHEPPNITRPADNHGSCGLKEGGLVRGRGLVSDRIAMVLEVRSRVDAGREEGQGGGRSGVLDPLWRDGLRGAVPDIAGVPRAAPARRVGRDPDRSR